MKDHLSTPDRDSKSALQESAFEGISIGKSSAPPAFSLSTSPIPKVTDPNSSPDKLSLTITPGELTKNGEGNDDQTRFVHRPNTDASGVTIGKGYDIGSRSQEKVIEELMAAGMTENQATKISKGAGLKGKAADDWITTNKLDIGEIPLKVQYSLLATMLKAYEAEAKTMATSEKATKDSKGNYLNAAGREIKDEVEAGTYRMTEKQWANLHPAMLELLTDLKYQGGYYAYDRIAKINALLIKNDGNHLEQFKAVATLFEAQDGEELSLMDTYGKAQGEGTGSTETFYEQKKETINGATTRRNRVRLSFLKSVIAALEDGREVIISKGDQVVDPVTQTIDTPDQPTTNQTDKIGITDAPGTTKEVRPPIPKGRLIAESVGASGTNHADDVAAIYTKLQSLEVISESEATNKSETAISEYVRRYQSLIFNSHPDGLIEPGKATETKLISGIKTKPIASSNPKEGTASPEKPQKGQSSKNKPTNAAFPYAEYVADQIYDAMFGGITGWTTDEERIMTHLRLLEGNAQRITMFKEVYKQKYKAEIEVHLREELSNSFLWGNELDDALDLLKAKEKGPQDTPQDKPNRNGKASNRDIPTVGRIINAEDWRSQLSNADDSVRDSEPGGGNCKLVSEKMVYRHLYDDLPDDFKRSQVVTAPDGKYEYIVGTVGSGQYLSVQREDKAFVKDIQSGTRKKSILKTAKDADLAIDYLSGYIARNIPVVVGVDHTYNRSLKKSDGSTSSKNTVGYNEGTTDHFVTIVGQGMEGGKRYFEFFDPGTRHKDNATRTQNRLVETSSNVFVGEQPWKDQNGKTITYTLSMVMLFDRDCKSYTNHIQQNNKEFSELKESFAKKQGDFSY